MVRIADMSAVLGRLSFALTALNHLRPFLGPIFAWVAALQSTRTYQVPKAIKLIMLFLAKALEGPGRLAPVRASVQQPEAFRTDARAEGDEIWLGGWAMDHVDTKKCRWFSEKLNPQTAPWLYAAGDSYRQIASLELLATLAAVVSFGVGGCPSCHIACSSGTDNRGNWLRSITLAYDQVSTLCLFNGACDTAACQECGFRSLLATTSAKY